MCSKQLSPSTTTSYHGHGQRNMKKKLKERTQ